VSRYSDWTMSWTTEELVFDSWQGQDIFLLSTAFKPVLGPTQSPIQRVPASVCPGVKQSGHEADLPLVLRLGTVELCLHYPICLQDVVLNYIIKYRENSSFTYPWTTQQFLQLLNSFSLSVIIFVSFMRFILFITNCRNLSVWKTLSHAIIFP
jgi:hypothetical protein